MTEKLALDSIKDLKYHKNYLEFKRTAEEGLLKFGKLSVPYLMRKLKCSESMASMIMEDLGDAF